jgi:hypothetical protein
MSRKLIDLTGLRFGSWTVLQRFPQNYVYGECVVPLWVCRCDCGNTSVVTGPNLRYGKSTGCVKCREQKRVDGVRRSNKYANRGEQIYG